MKRIIPFSRYFFPAAVFSSVVILAGVISYFAMGGFNLGVDFRAGLIQEIQFAPPAFRLTYSGLGKASISFSGDMLYIVISGSGVEGKTYSFPFAQYKTLDSLLEGLSLSSIAGLNVTGVAPGATETQHLIQSAQENPELGSEPFVVHYLAPGAEAIGIDEVRSTLSPLGSAAVQVLGEPSDRHFMIRMEDSETESVPVEKILGALEAHFGEEGVVVTRSDYVGSRFSKQLTDQVGILLSLTLILILAYAAFRFKPHYAVGAVIAIIHDAIITAAFVTWTRMEFNTTTIAALLTILGYSINDTIVIFDRIRETTRIYPEDNFEHILNRSITETLSRTIITTLTTMLAVFSLFIFTTGSMKEFALALLVGMTSGVYSTIFIAVGFVYFWDFQKRKGAKKKLSGSGAKKKVL
jgi:preprotein translocase subunit SecF